MMKFINRFWVACFILLAFTLGLQVEAEPLYLHSDVSHISFTLPEGWREMSVEEQQALGIQAGSDPKNVLEGVFRRDKEPSPLLFLTSHNGLAHESFDATKDLILENKLTLLPDGFSEDRDGLDERVDREHNAVYLHFRMPEEQGIAAFFVGKESVVEVELLGEPAWFEQELPEMQKILDSFDFIPNYKLPIEASIPWYFSGDMIEFYCNILLFGGFITVGYVVGTVTEKNHYRSIKEREAYFAGIPVFPMNLKTVLAGEQDSVVSAHLVSGSVVLSEDYFKGFLAMLKSFMGGNLTSYESLLDRARRESILRMQAQAIGADFIVNLRLETSSIGKEGGADGKGAKTVEVMAYGTAIRLKK